MGKWIVGLALAGWAGIIWLAWRLADSRIEICYSGDDACELRATAARDYVLIVGLTVALAFLIVSGLIAARSANGSISVNWPRERQAQAIVDAKSNATSKGKGIAFAFAKVTIALVLAMIALLGVALYLKPAAKPVGAGANVAAVEAAVEDDAAAAEKDTMAATLGADSTATWEAAETAYSVNAKEGAEPTCEELKLVARENDLGVISCGE